MSNLKGKVAIVGIGQTPFYKRGTSPYSERKMVLQAIVGACEDAGVDPRDVDGFATFSWDRHNGAYLMHEMGSRELRWSSMVEGGGGGGIPGAVGMAAAAIITGQAECIAVYRAIAEKEFGRFNTTIETTHADNHFTAHGVVVAHQMVGVRTQRMLYEHGVPRSALEALALADYFHARTNPRAMAYNNTVDAATYRNSRMVCEPFRLFDCSRETDGSACVLVMSAERARDLRQKPVYLLGVASGNPGGMADSADNYDSWGAGTGSFTTLAKRLWDQTGLKPSDIDTLQVYENFSGAGVAAIMDHGFFTPETVHEVMTVENLTVPTGKLPTNTSGGSLADGFIHGMEVLLEGARQVRGQSANQVKDAKLSLVVGGPCAICTSTAIFGSEETLQ